MKKQFKYALTLSAAGLLDNITTHYALVSGARELNPIVYLFTNNTLLFTIFTIAKTIILFTVAYTLNYNSKKDKIIYYTLLAIFTQAVILNTVNALVNGVR